MGLFDSIKSAFGTKAEEEDITASPSQMLRDAGIDPSGLKFGFGAGSITVSGAIAEEADRQKILDVLGALPGISTVQDDMAVAEPAPADEPEASAAAPEPDEAPATDPAPEPESGAKTYTVQSGDTLWKISQEVYGDGSQYKKIFEANTDILKDPDHIYPGQELKIPE